MREQIQIAAAYSDAMSIVEKAKHQLDNEPHSQHAWKTLIAIRAYLYREFNKAVAAL